MVVRRYLAIRRRRAQVGGQVICTEAYCIAGVLVGSRHADAAAAWLQAPAAADTAEERGRFVPRRYITGSLRAAGER
jgi:hypothetical protein